MIETGSFHLMAIPTTTKRRVLDTARKPGIVKSGEFEECYEAALGLVFNNAERCARRDLVIGGSPAIVTDDWVYYILPGKEI